VVLENRLVKERHTKQSEITAAVLTAQENERAQIGNELSENLNQVLAAAKMYIQLAAKYPSKRQKYLDMSSGFIEQVILGITKISKTLIIGDTRILSLIDNIKTLVRDLSLVHPLIIEFNAGNTEIGLLNEKLQLTIFRIIQEQTNNILIHSNATQARINLSRLNDEIILCISDNGDGCDVLKESDGVGIINIKTRAELHDGRIAIVSIPGKGYELKVELSMETNMAKRRS
jgi:signal transduction histidine kinase